jgi:hypothetical protein
MHGAFYSCEQCETRFTYVSRSDWYYALCENRLPIDTSPAWCFDCGTLRAIEELPSLEQCQNEVDDCQAARTSLGTRLAYPKRLEIAKLKLEWRKKRITGPKCIWCGGTNHKRLATDVETGLLPFTHDDCGGTIRFSKSFLGSAVPTLFDADGNRYEME